MYTCAYQENIFKVCKEMDNCTKLTKDRYDKLE